MHMNKKKLLSLSVVIIMIAILSFSSLAWFSDADEVTNQFQIADSESDPDEIFSVDVWEYVEGGTEKDQDGHIYEDILPGGRYHKEPYVENTGKYDQFIRVHVTVNNADAWIAALGNGYDLGTMFEGHDESAWTRYEPGVYSNDTNGSYYTMTFYLNYILEPGQTACLFNTVVIPGQLTQNDMAFVGGAFDLKIVAEAVQTENLGDGVDTAVEAFAVLDQSGQDIDQIP